MALPAPLLTAPAGAPPIGQPRRADPHQPVLRSGSPPAQRSLPLRQAR
jgi:hypothetical protein